MIDRCEPYLAETTGAPVVLDTSISVARRAEPMSQARMWYVDSNNTDPSFDGLSPATPLANTGEAFRRASDGDSLTVLPMHRDPPRADQPCGQREVLLRTLELRAGAEAILPEMPDGTTIMPAPYHVILASDAQLRLPPDFCEVAPLYKAARVVAAPPGVPP